jgi:hypothetical protein
MAAGAAHANASDKIVLVPPTDLPALARQAGEAMSLHDTIDGRTLQVRETVTKADTGTTFMLTKNGLYVIRRPTVVESSNDGDCAELKRSLGKA